MATTRDVSSGARAAIGRARSVLKPYSDEPRIAALVDKLNAIASPADISGDSDALEDSVAGTTVEKANGGMSREAQLRHLRSFNPRAADAWERTRAGDPNSNAAYA